MRYVSRLLLAFGVAFLAPEIANALVRIDIDLSTQRMQVASDSGENYEWPISSGRTGHLTPRGRYRPIALYKMVHSAKYDNAPMPHSIFFLSQYAIHGTNAVGSLGRPASHGCIRLAPANAATLYAMVKSEGATIRISGDTPASARIARGERRQSTALGYAPLRRERMLKEWARDPFEGY
jgi:lipoprotein-anchoring transpeptidase ErfK/SrfK